MRDGHEQLQGVLSTIKFHQGNFLIGVLDDGTTVKGSMLSPQVGLEYTFRGRRERHPRWGEQFAFTDYRASYPTDLAAIQCYLVDNCKWIGPEIGKRLVNTYGKETLAVCKADPDRVASEINGITPRRAKEIAAMLRNNEANENLQLALKDLLGGTKVNRRAVNQILEKWGQDAPARIRENPYALIEAIDGIGFLTADEVARKIGYDFSGPPRVRAGVIHTLKEQAFGQGHTCLPKAKLLAEAEKILAVPPERIGSELGPMEKDGLVVSADGFVYLKGYHDDEQLIAEKLKVLARQTLPPGQPDFEGLADDQKEALSKAVSSGVFILTGAPGTGKTYTIKRIISSFPEARVALAAPTGKAAKRVYEQSGRLALTIHKLLEPQKVGGSFVFTRDAENPIEADLIVLDEVSMVDTPLMARFLEAVAAGTRLILVGDTYQLPSVGPGNILKDLIASGAIPSTELTIIKRQNEGLIIRNCFAGETPVLTRDGLRPIRELRGEVEILTEGGLYRRATFRSFGTQRLMRVELTTGEVLHATPDHEWVVDLQHGIRKRVPTTELAGKYIPINLPRPPQRDEVYLQGVRHGIVFGDGNRISSNSHCEVFLYGPKRSLAAFFEKDSLSEQTDGSLRVGRLPGSFKTLPADDYPPSYWYGFICGLIATDGTVTGAGGVQIDQARLEPLLAVWRHAPAAGLLAHAVQTIHRPDPFTGEPRTDYRLTIRKGTIRDDDLLREDHRRRFIASAHRQASRVGVRSVRMTDRIEEVFCCVEPETHTMTVGAGYLTGQCHRIKNGEDIELGNSTARDFFFLKREDEESMQETILELVSRRFPESYKADPLKEVQVITPLREKTALSCKALNEVFQRRLNPKPKIDGVRFKVGDKVIQTKNQYDLDIINGDIGYVRDIDARDRTITVAFENPERVVQVPLHQNDLELAYAITCHRFQGSEARIVVVPVHRCFGPLIFQRNWAYTAISRAREVCVLVGQRDEFTKAIKRNQQQKRFTGLLRFLGGSA
jgi:ATP-dependent exoDNAse (exonuclease V) alpha subunit